MAQEILYGTGWRPDPADHRDYTQEHAAVSPLLASAGIRRAKRKALPPSVDLRRWCSPVPFQGYYNTCSAHVVAGMLETLEERAHGTSVAASRLFLYQVARRMLGETGDPGVYLRQMMGTVALVGVPPEKYWPYLDTKVKDDPRLAAEPDAFCYAVARDFRAVKYYRLDPQGWARAKVLADIRTHLAAGLPTSLGFPLFKSSLVAALKSGELPMPGADEAAMGRHAVLLVGYDDGKKIAPPGGGEPSEGAFLIKNSWGTQWGEEGYGWLPYAYLLEGMAHDAWTMIQASWVETEQFQLSWESEGSGSAGAGEASSGADSAGGPGNSHNGQGG